MASSRCLQGDFEEEVMPFGRFEHDFDDGDAAKAGDVIRTGNKTSTALSGSSASSSTNDLHHPDGEKATPGSLPSSPHVSRRTTTMGETVAGPPPAESRDDTTTGDDFRRRSPSSSSSSSSFGRSVRNNDLWCDDGRTPSSGSFGSDDVAAASLCPATGASTRRRDKEQPLDRRLCLDFDNTSCARQTPAREWPRAPHYALLLTTACRSMRGSLHGEDSRESTDRSTQR